MTVERVALPGEIREKTIAWRDPIPTAELGRSLSGLDFLTGIAENRFSPPPIASHFGMRWVSVAHGDVVLAATPDESLYNPIGTVHGGVAATMLDSAVACAVQSTLPAGMGLRTVRGSVCVCDRTYVLLGG
jgi:hypothetical protein